MTRKPAPTAAPASLPPKLPSGGGAYVLVDGVLRPDPAAQPAATAPETDLQTRV